MLYVLFNKGLPVHVTSTSPFTGTPKRKTFFNLGGSEIIYDEVKEGWDYESFEEVEGLALRLTAMTGRQFLASDAGPSISPRFNVFEPPELGDEVSYSFNGDTYPCGVITKITKAMHITTSTGKKFRRYKQTSGWQMEGGTWSLVRGHIYEQNPHF